MMEPFDEEDGEGVPEVETSESGAPILRYGERARPFEPASGDGEAIAEISAHIARHVGEVGMVFHEIVSDLVHVDVHHVPPHEGRPFHTLITSGMSDLPMDVPPGAEGCEFAELMLCLPPSWLLTQEAFANDAYYWPIRWLKLLARFPHEYRTWLWWGHSMPNGDPARPFAPNTKLCGVVLSRPVLAPPEFGQLTTEDGRTIHVFSVVPVYAEEMSFKLKERAEALLDRLDRGGISELLDVKRKNVCAKSRWPFR